MFMSELGTGLNMTNYTPTFTHAEWKRFHQLNNNTLKHLLGRGIGIHHAGLHPDDRSFVEEMYRKRRFIMLISTTTLAAGVNTPATIVFVVGTIQYDRKENERYNVPISEVHQMMGRAGRIGTNNSLTTAHAFVITTKKDAKRICQTAIEPVLSQLLVDNNFEETLNGHIAHCQGTDTYMNMTEW